MPASSSEPDRTAWRRRRGWTVLALVCFVAAIIVSWTEGARDLRLEGVAILVALVGCAALLRAARPGASGG
ncbi:MAG TPA: hypothetical protein VNN74_11725 [Candidatus Micrarchaeia archaeon]|nr:hypothetical protein [Candidatus Micrarchaeia archaeon]